ncbi:hypothetical protein BGX21_009457 [Mortierella sp. AD011]|nr:hypothetical protein BGX21_009457 [Mortierella sp. AD011]
MSRQLYQPLSVPASQFDVVNHPVKDTLVIVSTILSILVHKNDSRYDPMRDPITLFHSRAVPRISIEAYLIRILQYIPFTNEVLLNVLVYLDRIGGLEGMQLQQGGALTSTTSSSTKTTGTTETTTAITMTKLMESSSTKNPEIYRSESSNSNLSLPVVQKRGRSDHEDVVERNDDNNSNNNKRSRTDSVSPTSSSSSCASVISPSTPVSTPPPTPSLPLPSSNGFRINSFNIHRLLITCLMVAAKFTSDLFYSNARYAKVGGLSLPELNQLELEFLFTTKFELNVKVDELQRVGNALLQFRDRHMARAVQQQQLQQQLQQRQQQQQQLCLQLQMRAQCQQQYSMLYATPSPKSPSPASSEVISVPVQTTW